MIMGVKWFISFYVQKGVALKILTFLFHKCAEDWNYMTMILT
jgi:hypothetical protein